MTIDEGLVVGGMGEEIAMIFKGLSKFLVFSGENEEYENWRVLVDDWVDMEDKERKYLDLEIMREVQGKPLNMLN